MDNYNPPSMFKNEHLATIIPNLLRSVKSKTHVRKTVDTRDGDFLDLDIHSRGSRKAALLIHGLEGSSKSTYMRGMANTLSSIGMDVVSVNLRGCSGKLNIQPYTYHSGKTEDVADVINLLHNYDEIVLVGFSLGGNIALKYAGQSIIDNRLKCVVGISVPADLKSAAMLLSKPKNRIYLSRFLNQLKQKSRQKLKQFPELPINLAEVNNANTFPQFDDAFTAPLNGFESADDYYIKCSAINDIQNIRVPTLIINAQNDPFLTQDCTPKASINSKLTILNPRYGGHVGFASDHLMKKPFWHEEKTAEFILAINAH